MSGSGRYGKFRYGSIEQRSSDAPPSRRRGTADLKPSEAEVLGRGLALNPAHREGYDWDLVVSSSGSLLMTGGFDEYVKDMAYKTAKRLYDVRGEQINPELIADLELDIELIVASEERTQSVSAIAVSRPEENTIRVDVEAVLIGGYRRTSTFGLPAP